MQSSNNFLKVGPEFVDCRTLGMGTGDSTYCAVGLFT